MRTKVLYNFTLEEKADDLLEMYMLSAIRRTVNYTTS